MSYGHQTKHNAVNHKWNYHCIMSASSQGESIRQETIAAGRRSMISGRWNGMIWQEACMQSVLGLLTDRCTVTTVGCIVALSLTHTQRRGEAMQGVFAARRAPQFLHRTHRPAHSLSVVPRRSAARSKSRRHASTNIQNMNPSRGFIDKPIHSFTAFHCIVNILSSIQTPFTVDFTSFGDCFSVF